MKLPTDKQLAILVFIIAYAREHLKQPTLQEVGEVFEISSEGVRGHLLALERKQLIEYTGKGPRNIRITDEALDLVGSHIQED